MELAQIKLYPNWQEVITFSKDGPQPKKLLETETLTAVMVGLEAGQKLPPHPAPAATYHFLEGSGQMIVAGERLPVEAGATVVVPDGTTRGIEAETQLAFLGVRAA